MVKNKQIKEALMNAEQKQPVPKKISFANYAILPVAILLIIVFGWFIIHNPQVLTQTTIAAYQQAQLEIVRAAARGVAAFVTDQVNDHNNTDMAAIEQAIFIHVIAPIRLLENGDAWIYAPDHVVYDQSADFPDTYRGKSMAEIFALQKANGASHYEEMTDAVMNAREGVGWYIWLPDKGREIAAWSPVDVGGHVWTIGLSTPLPEILEAAGVTEQIRTNRVFVGLGAVIILGLLAAWQVSINRRNQAEKTLYEQRHLFKSVLDNALTHIWAFDGERYFYLSKSFYEYTGQDESMLPTIEKWTDFVHPDDLEQAGKVWQTAWAGKSEHDNYFRLRNVEGFYKHFWCHAVPIYTDNDVFSHFQGFNIDITEQKQAQNALQNAHDDLERQVEQRTAELVKTNETLRASEKFLQDITSNVPALLFQYELDADGKEKFTFISNGIRELMELEPEVVMADAKVIWDTYLEEYIPKLMEKIHKSSVKLIPWRATYQIKTARSGVIKWVEGLGIPQRMNNGGIIWNGWVIDITEHKNSEKLLIESEERFKALSDATYEGIFFTDMGVIIDANRAACKMSGYSYDELIGMNAIDLIAAENLQKVKQKMLVNYEKPYDAIVQNKDGFKFHVQIQGKMFEYQGRLIRVATIIDITKRKEDEKKLRNYIQTQETMALELSHRVKNNLVALSGMLLIEQRFLAKSAERHAQAAILDKLANRIRGLTTVYDLLSGSDWASAPLNELARRIVHAALQTLPSDKRPQVCFFCAAHVSATPEEAHHLAIILNELATNVVKHAVPAKKNIQISVRITPEADNKTIRVEFRDNGPGFPETALVTEGRNAGLYLVENTARHSLEGDVTFHNDDGAVVTIAQIKLQHPLQGGWSTT
jgi:PAS domain S-box-containing protein